MNEVRINVVLSEEERDAFDRWCRYGPKPRTSMNWRIRELLRADAAGKVDVPRTPPPKRGVPPKAKAPAPAPKRRHSAPPRPK